MNPLTFPCPKCAKRMGVGLELAGQSVRCPHCREVVVAPTTATAPEQDLLQAGPRESAESIFADPEESDDSLFAGPAPKVLTLPPPDPQPLPARLPNPLITPPPTLDPNPFAVTDEKAPTPSKRKPVEKKPFAWKQWALYALIGYAVLMTLLAAWGWMRSPSPQLHPTPVKAGR